MPDEGKSEGVGLLDGGGTAEWLGDFEGIADDESLRKSLSKFNSPEDVFRAYPKLESKLGSSISLPKDDAPDDEKAAQLDKIYAKLGRPEKPEDYTINKPDKMPEGAIWSDDFEAKARILAHKNGWNDKQLQAAIQTWGEMIGSMVKKGKDTQSVAAEQAAQQLREKWGEAKFEVNMTAAEQAFKRVVPEPLQAVFTANGLHNDARFVEWMHDVFQEKLGEGQFITGEPKGAMPTQAVLNYSKMKKR